MNEPTTKSLLGGVTQRKRDARTIFYKVNLAVIVYKPLEGTMLTLELQAFLNSARRTELKEYLIEHLFLKST